MGVAVMTLVALGVSFAAWWALPSLRSAIEPAITLLLAAEPRDVVRALRDYLLGFGAWAAAVSAALMVLQSVLAPIPAVIVTLANGMLFGWVWGAALSWSSAMVGAAVCFGIARSLGRPVVERLVGGTHALGVSDLFFARYGHRAVLICRLLPFVSFDVISYGAGLTSMRFLPFLIATGVGQLPATMVISAMGEGIVDTVPMHFWVACLLIAAGLVIWPVVVALLRKAGMGRRASGAGEGSRDDA